jgi:hypothetical protein
MPPGFADPAMEARYRAADDGKCIRLLRVGAVVGAGLVAAMGLVVHFFAPAEVMSGTFPPQAAFFGCLAMLGGVALTYVPAFQRHPQAAVAGFASS